MFGYVMIDKPNMLIKDYYLYRSVYCGICKAFKHRYSNVARLFTNYDVTFFAVLACSVSEQKCDVKEENCILNPLKKKPVMQNNPILSSVADLSVLLGEYKLNDDINDGDKKKKIARILFKRDIKRAHAARPDLADLIDDRLKKLGALEREKCSSCDRIAAVFADMMREAFKSVLGHSYTAESGKLMYEVARWVYLSDALDDIDDDIKNGTYNPFLCEYENVSSKQTFFEQHRLDIEFILDSAYNGIHRAYEDIPSTDFEGVLTNILWYGILNKNKKLLNLEVEPKPWERASAGFGKKIK